MHSKLWTGPPLGPPLLRSRPPTRKSNSRGPLSHSSGPANHWAFAFGSAKALKISIGVALKVRSMTKVAWTTETVEATLPGVTTLCDPSLGRLQCLRLYAANANPPGFPGAHQAARLEDRQMLHHGG